MKFFVGLLLAVAVCSTVGLPARDPNSDAEYVSPQDDFKGFSGVIDTGADFPSPADPFGVQSDGFLSSSFSDIMRQFRERVFGNWWNNIPTLDVGELDPSTGNSTSVVKVINGHRVEINNTVYTKASPDGSSVYKVRVVNMRPLDEDDVDVTSTVDQDSTEPTPVETSPKPKRTQDREELDNEVGDGFGASESTSTQLHDSSTTTPSEIDQEAPATTTLRPNESREEIETADASEPTQNSEDNMEKGFENLEFKDALPSKSASSEEMNGNLHEGYNPSSNSREAAYSMMPLHTEFSEEEPELDHTYTSQSGVERSEWDSIEDWHTNHENNNIDDFQSVPVDLSNDIDVNNILADQGAPTNPDAEVFAVLPQNNYSPSPYFQSIRPSYGWYPSQPSLVWPKRK